MTHGEPNWWERNETSLWVLLFTFLSFALFVLMWRPLST